MSSDVVIEVVPKFVRRYGDYVVEGSNNTIIIMGTDRAKKGPAKVSDGLGHIKAANKGKGTATIHIIAGRSAADPDFSTDASFMYLTKKSNIDDNLGLGAVESPGNSTPAAVLKSDSIRIVGRKDIKICANNDDKHFLFMDGKKIKISFKEGPATLVVEDKKITITMGTNTVVMDDKQAKVTVDKTILTMNGKLVKIDSPKINLVGGCGKPWDELFKKIDKFATTHQHMTAVGPSTPTLPPTPAVDITTALDSWNSEVSPA